MRESTQRRPGWTGAYKAGVSLLSLCCCFAAGASWLLYLFVKGENEGENDLALLVAVVGSVGLVAAVLSVSFAFKNQIARSTLWLVVGVALYGLWAVLLDGLARGWASAGASYPFAFFAGAVVVMYVVVNLGRR